MQAELCDAGPTAADRWRRQTYAQTGAKGGEHNQVGIDTGRLGGQGITQNFQAFGVTGWAGWPDHS